MKWGLHMCRDACVEVRGQLSDVSSLLSPFRGWVLGTGLRSSAYMASTLSAEPAHWLWGNNSEVEPWKKYAKWKKLFREIQLLCAISSKVSKHLRDINKAIENTDEDHLTGTGAVYWLWSFISVNKNILKFCVCEPSVTHYIHCSHLWKTYFLYFYFVYIFAQVYVQLFVCMCKEHVCVRHTCMGECKSWVCVYESWMCMSVSHEYVWISHECVCMSHECVWMSHECVWMNHEYVDESWVCESYECESWVCESWVCVDESWICMMNMSHECVWISHECVWVWVMRVYDEWVLSVRVWSMSVGMVIRYRCVEIRDGHQMFSIYFFEARSLIDPKVTNLVHEQTLC